MKNQMSKKTWVIGAIILLLISLGVYYFMYMRSGVDGFSEGVVAPLNKRACKVPTGVVYTSCGTTAPACTTGQDRGVVTC
jgi:hypothetical protein